MSLSMEDRTGKIRSPEEFEKAASVVSKRMVAMPPGDIELFMEFTTILDALKIAAAVARTVKEKAK